MSTVKRAIKKLAEVEPPIVRGIVLDVDKNAYTCTVQIVSNDGMLENVKLKPIVNSGDPTQLGLVLFPAVQSIVTIGQVNGDDIDNVVIGYTVIDSMSMSTATALKILLDSGGNFSLNATGITLNGGNNGGIPMSTPLAMVILQLQQQVNQLIETFNTHIHPASSGTTSPTLTPGPAVTTQTIKPSDIANPSIKQ